MPQQLNQKNKTLVIALILGFFWAAPLVSASSGTINSVYKYAWGNDAGWINFAPSQSTVTVTDSAVTGYVWSTNDGWINLSPSNGGVTNSGGTLGGWAWDQSAGWISFSGVTINPAGRFHGEATGDNGYVINFDCSNCSVQTSWRPHDSSSGSSSFPPAFGSSSTTPASVGPSASASNQTGAGAPQAYPSEGTGRTLLFGTSSPTGRMLVPSPSHLGKSGTSSPNVSKNQNTLYIIVAVCLLLLVVFGVRFLI